MRPKLPGRLPGPAATHLLAWVFFAAVMFLQPPGRTAADTKLDLVADPAGFLAGALHAYTPEFTLGQLQNQAYGYLFPQGLFFLLAEPLPEWVAQRLWWTIVVGTGFSGFLLLARHLSVGSPAFQVLAAGLYGLSPRTLTTLTAISSETWPVMLAPWVVRAVLSPRLGWRALAAGVMPVALMGAVNATTTLLACLPAGLALGWRLFHPSEGTPRRRTGLFTAAWLAGCAAVSAWWIGPLLVLGAYAAPFTDFIESSYVTTRWLNLAEIVRGTTSWAPFVDAERRAGALLVGEPVYVLVTVAVAAFGLIGLCVRGLPARGLWLLLLFTGIAVLGAAHGPLGAGWLGLLDGPLSPFRNLHKADLLVRIPLLVGVAHLGSRLRFPTSRAELAHPGKAQAGAALVGLVAVAAISPAVTTRLLPAGTWDEVPEFWVDATKYLNDTAAGTRTLLAPEASFARQDWGWTRDEPAQPLLEVPWAVRDAIPLIEPEAIRGLDGVMGVLEHYPETAGDVLAGLGIGAVLIRDDLDPDGGIAGRDIDADALAEAPGATSVTFGDNNEITVITFDPTRRGYLTEADPVTVAGGGESLPMLDALTEPGARQLVAADADIVTDTPLLVARNYGTLTDPVSAPLADREEGADVRNREIDYPSTGPLTRVVEYGGTVHASSSAAQATSFGGADPARSVTAAVDGHDDTAWWPAPGPADGEWIELSADFVPQARLSVTATEDTDVTISTAPLSQDPPHTTVSLPAGEPKEIVVPGPATGTLRVTLAGPAAAGIAELSVADDDVERTTTVPDTSPNAQKFSPQSLTIAGHDVERVVTVPDTSPDARMFFLQRLAVDTDVLIRDITIPRDMTVRVDATDEVRIDDHLHSPGDEIELTAGTHRVESEALWVTLTEPGFHPATPTTAWAGGPLAPSEHDRILFPGVSANEGLTARLAGHRLEPVSIGPGLQGFVVPAGAEGDVELSFSGDHIYRLSLFGGGTAGVLVLLIAGGILVSTRRQSSEHAVFRSTAAPGVGTAAVGAGALVLAVGWPALVVVGAVAAIRRFTLIPTPVLAGVLAGIGGAWLARAPWPSGSYAGDETILTLVIAGALACALPPVRRRVVAGDVDKHPAEGASPVPR